MLIKLDDGKGINTDAIATIEAKGTKVYYVLVNNTTFSENFDTEEEAQDRIDELFPES